MKTPEISFMNSYEQLSTVESAMKLAQNEGSTWDHAFKVAPAALIHAVETLALTIFKVLGSLFEAVKGNRSNSRHLGRCARKEMNKAGAYLAVAFMPSDSR
jgi:hypothetical protein